jgi:hypothetical protein
MEFELEGISEHIVALTYNMSFASDLGMAVGSEANFVARAINTDPNNPRAYWKNAAKLVDDFVKTKNPAIMYFQEMNDRNKIIRDPAFDGGYQALLEQLATGAVSYIETQISYPPPPGSPLISYYTRGIYSGKNSTNYSFLAYSIEKTEPYGKIYPTVLTIWDTDTLGGFIGLYGNDLGLHPNYNVPFHYGRNFSCITTSKGANLINLHGPNDSDNVKTKLKPAIENYMTQAATNFNTQHADKDWNEALTVIGGDTNDTGDAMKTIDFTRTTTTTTYNYKGNAPLSCCAEYFNEWVYYLNATINDTIYKYRNSGDKLMVKNLNSDNPLFYLNQLYIPTPGVLYGGRRHSRNLKKKKLLKKRKTIKKRHYKLKNKKSFKKRRIFRRKTRKHTHKQ